MRIAVAVCNYAPYRSGISNVAERHNTQLRELGHEVEVFCPAHEQPPGEDTVDGVPVHRMRPLVRHGNSALVPALASNLRHFDALYLHYPFYGGAELAAAAAKLARIPYVVFFHMDVIWDGLRGRILWAYERSVAPLILKGAAQVLVSSFDYAENSSIGRYRLPNLKERPYALDHDRYRVASVAPSAIHALGLDPTRKTILFVGAMDGGHAFKGVPELIRAFAQSKLAGRAQLALVGDGDLRPGYERQVADFSLDESVHFLGRISEDDLVTAYQSARVTVLPSTTGEEAFGVVLAEAMACGSPVIASDLPGVRANFSHGREGYLVPPGDVVALAAAIQIVVDDDDQHARMREAGIERARSRFSQSEERRMLGEIFASLRGLS